MNPAAKQISQHTLRPAWHRARQVESSGAYAYGLSRGPAAGNQYHFQKLMPRHPLPFPMPFGGDGPMSLPSTAHIDWQEHVSDLLMLGQEIPCSASTSSNYNWVRQGFKGLTGEGIILLVGILASVLAPTRSRNPSVTDRLKHRQRLCK